jgi:serine/threonine protein kinase
MSDVVRLEPGTVLTERYEILEVIGRGGMGTVYRARDVRLDTVVAVKEMKEPLGTEEEQAIATRHFEREAKLLAQLAHPNLPRVTDYFIEDGRYYLIMEFIEGETLDSILRRTLATPLPLRDVLSWGVQLADVLSYLHTQEPPIIFRDLKPANIMRAEENTIKLIDFGIARRFQAGATKDTILYGSSGYAPPEQYGRGQTDPRSDIYALGATLHHLLTGRDPASTPFKFPPIRQLVPSLPPALELFIARCVELEPERRWQSAAEARDTLVQILNTVVIAERNAAQAEPKENKLPTAIKSAGPRIYSSRLHAAERARFIRRIVVGVGLVLVLLGVGTGTYILHSRARNLDKPMPHQSPKTLTAVPNPMPAPFGMLQVTSVPQGARVLLDDKEIGVTPFTLGKVSAGIHTLKFFPPSESGLPSRTRQIYIYPGQTTTIEESLVSGPYAEIVQVVPELVDNPQEASTAVRIGVRFRITGALGKSGMVGAFFYGLDQSTPLSPRLPNSPYQNEKGELSVAASFQAKTEPAEIKDFVLTVPASAFPVPLNQVTYRIILFIDGKAIGQTPVSPLFTSP